MSAGLAGYCIATAIAIALLNEGDVLHRNCRKRVVGSVAKRSMPNFIQNRGLSGTLLIYKHNPVRRESGLVLGFHAIIYDLNIHNTFMLSLIFKI